MFGDPISFYFKKKWLRIELNKSRLKIKRLSYTVNEPSQWKASFIFRRILSVLWTGLVTVPWHKIYSTLRSFSLMIEIFFSLSIVIVSMKWNALINALNSSLLYREGMGTRQKVFICFYVSAHNTRSILVMGTEGLAVQFSEKCSSNYYKHNMVKLILSSDAFSSSTNYITCDSVRRTMVIDTAWWIQEVFFLTSHCTSSKKMSLRKGTFLQNHWTTQWKKHVKFL